tara:strand:+ start:1095 stop:1769 length:675 start_codon:yes stop_codon:yes gene_type:complete
MDMSPEENAKFNRLDKDDQLKLSAVMQMIQKEKDNAKKEDVNEITGETLDRLDGLIDQRLLISFLDKFEEIYYDFIEQGEEFEVGDVITFLEKMLYDRAEDARMEDQLPDGFSEASGEIGVDQQGDTTRDVNVTNDTSMYDPLKEDKTQMKTIVSFLKKNKGASDEEIKGFIKTHKDDIKDMTMSEIEDEFSEYIAANSDSVDEGVEWFQKIGGIVPLGGGNLM